MKSAVVFAGGSFDKSILAITDSIQDSDVWCADGGLVHALACGLTPYAIVGDLDSAPSLAVEAAVAEGAKLIKHPANKNASDLELTLRELVEADYKSVTLLAASGGRTDHALFNWMLVLQQDWPFQLTLIDDTISAYLVHADISFRAAVKADTVVSLLSRDSVSGVTTSGLKYKLVDARLMGGSTLGLSNEALGDGPVTVSVTSGRLLVCVVHTKKIN